MSSTVIDDNQVAQFDQIFVPHADVEESLKMLEETFRHLQALWPDGEIIVSFAVKLEKESRARSRTDGPK